MGACLSFSSSHGSIMSANPNPEWMLQVAYRGLSKGSDGLVIGLTGQAMSDG